jgi:hypothetical protein
MTVIARCRHGCHGDYIVIDNQPKCPECGTIAVESHPIWQEIRKEQAALLAQAAEMEKREAQKKKQNEIAVAQKRREQEAAHSIRAINFSPLVSLDGVRADLSVHLTREDRAQILAGVGKAIGEFEEKTLLEFHREHSKDIQELERLRLARDSAGALVNETQNAIAKTGEAIKQALAAGQDSAELENEKRELEAKLPALRNRQQTLSTLHSEANKKLHAAYDPFSAERRKLYVAQLKEKSQIEADKLLKLSGKQLLDLSTAAITLGSFQTGPRNIGVASQPLPGKPLTLPQP